MLKNLFGEKAPLARAPEGKRLYAIGDVHGCADLLDRLMDQIGSEERSAKKPSQLIFLGDYVDRGPDSRGVIDRLLKIRLERPETVFLKGNHEAVFLEFLDDAMEAADWLDWGGVETVQSYGVGDVATRDPVELAEELRARIPTEHLAFLKSLELWRVFGDYAFVHAGFKPGKAIGAQDERDMLWIRGEFHQAPPETRPDKVVVHGHQPIRKALDAGWRIDVDTGACFTGKLTAVVLDGAERRFIST
jgi:serine/threonine protein phosphatase 1